MENSAIAVIKECNDLVKYWSARDAKMRQWYRLIQMIDELKTEKMESFVGNDPRSMFNLILHMLDQKVSHRLANLETVEQDVMNAAEGLSEVLDEAWEDVGERFRRTGPRQDWQRGFIGLMLATGWYSVWAAVGDWGDRLYADIWNPIQVYPQWDIDLGLYKVAHVYETSSQSAIAMCRRAGYRDVRVGTQAKIYDLWWMEIDNIFPFGPRAWNAIVVDNTLIKFQPTRFSQIPVYVAPVGGLPDTGPLSEGAPASSTGTGSGERWKEEIGQSIVATNENIYRSWNKWWTFSLQLLRDTAQPRIFERSRTGKAIVKPEDVFKRGAIFRGGPEDEVNFIGTPPMPLELRSTQLDLEAMMQRGGVSWAMYGAVTGELTAYVMSQIAASVNQIMRPFHQAVMNFYTDVDNAILDDLRQYPIRPYDYSLPRVIKDNMKVTATYEIEVPGEIVQKATVARMLDPQFALSYSYTINKLFPDIKNPARERARRLADQAELSPENATIAQVRFYRRQAAYFANKDAETAELYRMAAEAAAAKIAPPQPEQPQQQAARQQIGNRPEGLPRLSMPEVQ